MGQERGQGARARGEGEVKGKAVEAIDGTRGTRGEGRRHADVHGSVAGG